MARLTVCLLGPFQVTLDGQPVTSFATDKVRALLAYLAVEDGLPHRREKLAGLLWPDEPESLARTNRRSTLARLRKAIRDDEAEPPLLHISPKTLSLIPEAGTWIDATELAALLQPAGEPAISCLEQAVALYRGPFLEGFSLPDSPLFEEWALFQRERLHRLVMEALNHLAEAYEARDELDRALVHAWRQLELDPSWESAHCQAMRLLARRGRRDAALAQFGTCRQRLADDLDVEPAAATVALVRQIHDGTLAQRAPPAPTAPRTPHNLPAPLTPFVGRETELAALGERLQHPTCRLLTLVGPGGIGKTRLALEAARARLADYPDGVFQVRLVGLASAESLVPTIAQAIGLRFAERKEPREQLTDFLRDRRMLLLMDNFEHLLEGTGQLVEILRAAPGVQIVVTSRARLNLKGEHLFAVEGLPYPPLETATGALAGPPAAEPQPTTAGEPISTADFAQYDAIRLFLSGARRVCPGFVLEGQVHAVARICRLVGGLPLAVLLASAWVADLAPGQIAARLSDGVGQGLDLLAADWSDVPARHRSMRAAFDHSWRLLSGGEQGIFAALSVFRGGFDTEAAEAVAGALRSDLRRLVDRSFLQRLPAPSTALPSASLKAGGSGGRYEVHELMRQYGAERLDADREAWEAAHDRHCAHYTARLAAWDADLKGARQYEALAELDVEIDNARAAWEWAVERGQVGRIDREAEGLCRFYFWRARLDEYKSTCRLAEKRLEELLTGGETCPADPVGTDRTRLLHVSAKVLGLTLLQCAADRRDILCQRALALLDRPELVAEDARGERALILQNMSRHFWLSDPGRALRYEEESLALYRELGDHWEIASRLLHGAVVMLRQPSFGRAAKPIWAEAQRLLEESLTLYQGLGAARSEALALMALGTLAFLQGRRAEGERLMRQFITTWREAGETAGLIGQLDGQAWTLLVLGRFREACFVMEEGLRLCSELGDRRGESQTRCRLAGVLAYDGAYAEAQAEAQRAVALGREDEDRFRIAASQMWLGGTALGQGQWAEAQHQLAQGAEGNRELARDHNLSLSLSYLGLAALRLGDQAGARGHMTEALRLATRGRNQTTGVIALGALSVMLLEAGRIEEALEIYSAVLRLPFFVHSRLWEDIAGRHIAAAAATLPPDVVAAAQERGRARDLMETAREMLAVLEAQMEETCSLSSGDAPSSLS